MALSMALGRMLPPLIIAALIITACGTPPSATPDDGTSHESTTTATPSSTVHFPQLRPPPDGPSIFPAALMIGQLVLEGTCLRVTAQGAESSLPIWPPEVTLNAAADPIELLNQDGEVIARVGDEVELGGGPTGAEAPLIEELREPLPEECPGPYWITSEVTGPGGRSRSFDAPSEGERAAGTMPEPIDPNDPLLQQYPDAPQYAADFGISLEEAVRRLQLQDSFPGLDETLRSQEANTFGGLWIQHEPEFRFVVAFTRNGEETIRQYVDDASLDLIEVRNVRYTLAELEAAQTETARVLEQADVRTNISTNVMENRVEVEVFDPEAVEEKLKAADVQLPEAATLVAVDAQASDGNGSNQIEATPTPLPPGVNVFFPQQAPTDGPRDMMAALIVGTLVYDDGCLRVASEGGSSHLIIWPPDVTLHATDEVIEIHDADGNVVARVDEQISMGGGESGSDHWERGTLRAPLPEQCPGPYWIVGEIE